MPRERTDAAALFDMLQAAETVLRYVAGKTREDFEQDDRTRHAVERNLEIIGEAARRLNKEFRDQHTEFEWRAIMATRHILAHDYDEVDNDIVWRITTHHIPPLILQLKALIPSPPSDEAAG